MRTCAGEAGGAAALYGPDIPFPEGLLLHRLFEEMLAGQSSEAGEKVWRDIRMTTRRILSGLYGPLQLLLRNRKCQKHKTS